METKKSGPNFKQVVGRALQKAFFAMVWFIGFLIGAFLLSPVWITAVKAFIRYVSWFWNWLPF